MAFDITLEGIDRAISALNFRNKNTPKYRLINAIRSVYIDIESPTALTTSHTDKLDTDTLVRRLWDTGDNLRAIKSRRRNFNSIKSAVNKDLQRLYRSGDNPEGITIGPDNTFVMSEEAKEAIFNTYTETSLDKQIADLEKIKDAMGLMDQMLSNPEALPQSGGNDQTDVMAELAKIVSRISDKMEQVAASGVPATGSQSAGEAGAQAAPADETTTGAASGSVPGTGESEGGSAANPVSPGPGGSASPGEGVAGGTFEKARSEHDDEDVTSGVPTRGVGRDQLKPAQEAASLDADVEAVDVAQKQDLTGDELEEVQEIADTPTGIGDDTDEATDEVISEAGDPGMDTETLGVSGDDPEADDSGPGADDSLGIALDSEQDMDPDEIDPTDPVAELDPIDEIVEVEDEELLDDELEEILEIDDELAGIEDEAQEASGDDPDGDDSGLGAGDFSAADDDGGTEPTTDTVDPDDPVMELDPDDEVVEVEDENLLDDELEEILEVDDELEGIGDEAQEAPGDQPDGDDSGVGADDFSAADDDGGSEPTTDAVDPDDPIMELDPDIEVVEVEDEDLLDDELEEILEIDDDGPGVGTDEFPESAADGEPEQAADAIDSDDPVMELEPDDELVEVEDEDLLDDELEEILEIDDELAGIENEAQGASGDDPDDDRPGIGTDNFSDSTANGGPESAADEIDPTDTGTDLDPDDEVVEVEDGDLLDDDLEEILEVDDELEGIGDEDQGASGDDSDDDGSELGTDDLPASAADSGPELAAGALDPAEPVTELDPDDEVIEVEDEDLLDDELEEILEVDDGHEGIGDEARGASGDDPDDNGIGLGTNDFPDSTDDNGPESAAGAVDPAEPVTELDPDDEVIEVEDEDLLDDELEEILEVDDGLEGIVNEARGASGDDLDDNGIGLGTNDFPDSTDDNGPESAAGAVDPAEPVTELDPDDEMVEVEDEDLLDDELEEILEIDDGLTGIGDEVQSASGDDPAQDNSGLGADETGETGSETTELYPDDEVEEIEADDDPLDEDLEEILEVEDDFETVDDTEAQEAVDGDNGIGVGLDDDQALGAGVEAPADISATDVDDNPATDAPGTSAPEADEHISTDVVDEADPDEGMIELDEADALPDDELEELVEVVDENDLEEIEEADDDRAGVRLAGQAAEEADLGDWFGDALDDVPEDSENTPIDSDRARMLAESFNQSLAAVDRYYNQHHYIDGGSYRVGLHELNRNPDQHSRPAHTIDLEPFFIGKFPVTNALFELFVEKTGYRTTAENEGFGEVYTGRFQKLAVGPGERPTLIMNAAISKQTVEGAFWYQPTGPGSSLHKRRHHPVVQVSLEDAMAFAAWTGKRLPTENEWEAAVRTQRANRFPWGNTPVEQACNFENTNIGETTAVDHYKEFANDLGLADALGNVWEWTLDTIPSPHGLQQDTRMNVVKGGCWISNGDVDATSRHPVERTGRSSILGFRCVAF